MRLEIKPQSSKDDELARKLISNFKLKPQIKTWVIYLKTN